jgi:hypothetical protein
MTDNGIVTLDAPRRIKNEDGSPVLPDAPPIAPTPTPASPHSASDPWYEENKHNLLKPAPPDWVDEQLLVAQIKQEQSTSQSWLLCDRCALNMVPVQQYTTCTSCHNLKFPDNTQWFADELGRRHQI